jgi:23S rRNA (cytosine1962-C5)-methyltransferase
MLRILDKPAGCTTHTSLSEEEIKRLYLEPHDGFLEYLSYRSGKKLSPVHRLDVETSGALLAWEGDGSQSSHAILTQISTAFEGREVEKTYFFISDRQPRRGFKSGDKVESHIARVKSGSARSSSGKRGPQYISHAPTSIEPINSSTTFEKVREHGKFTLWCAKPLTGKPHQIRLHAENAGIAILGDSEHGGTIFPVLCLHASQARWKDSAAGFEAKSNSPIWFLQLELLEDPILVSWLAAFDRRQRLVRSLQIFGITSSETRRELHGDSIGAAAAEGTLPIDLRLDRLGDIHQFHWYGNPTRLQQNFSDRELQRIRKFAELCEIKDWWLQCRSNRGSGQIQELIVESRDTLPKRWHATEENLRFLFCRDRGLSSGLFLDQRANRRWISQTRPRSILNLFSYTGGFSVAAAVAGAQHVVNVDLSRTFLEWTKENFQANRLDPSDPRYEFRALDAREYLKWAEKKGLKFDLVVCDPPSFSRTDTGVFRIEMELETLVQSSLNLTHDGGRLLISTNFENWSNQEFVSLISEIVKKFKYKSSREFMLERTPSPDWDFEFPREPRRLKSLFIKVAKN